MASVGEVIEQGEQCRWIEFRIDAIENGVKRFWIRKLLIPVRYLRQGENPTAHVVRGWTQQETGEIERLSRCTAGGPPFWPVRSRTRKGCPRP